MPYCSFQHLSWLASKENRAIGCVSVYNLESIQAVVSAAEQERAPVMLSIDNEAINHAGLIALGSAAIAAAHESAMPVTVHLNHCRSMDLIIQALDLGFGSVMFDGSELPYDENLHHTQSAVRMAHEAGAAIEGELGPLCGPVRGIEQADFLELACSFALETQVDILALSIPKNGGHDLNMLRLIADNLNIPLAIHGASNLDVDEFSRLTPMGVGVIKVNFHSEIKKTLNQTFKEALTVGCNSLDALNLTRNEVQSVVQDKLSYL